MPEPVQSNPTELENVVIRKKLILINSLSGVVANVLNIAVLAWLQSYLLKRISTDEYALYPVLAALIAFLPLLSTIFISGIGRYVMVAFVQKDEKMIRQIVSTMFTILVGLGIFILLIGFTASFYVDHILTVAPSQVNDARLMLAIMVLSFVSTMVMTPFRSGLYVHQKFVLINGLELANQLLRIVILFILLFTVSTRVLWVVTASAAANFVIQLVSVFVSRRLLPSQRFRFEDINWGIARTLTSFGGWSSVGQAAEMVRMRVDPIILNKLAAPFDVTCFHLGSLIASQVQGLVSILRLPLNPVLTALYAQSQHDRLKRAYLRGNRISLWISLFLSFPVVVFSKDIIHFWVGDKFLMAATVSLCLIITHFSLYSTGMLGPLVIAAAKVRESTLIGIVVQAIHLCLTVYFVYVHNMGAIGAALATMLSVTIALPILSYRFSLQTAGTNLGEWWKESIFPGWIPALITIGVLFALKSMLYTQTILHLIGFLTFGCLFYIFIMIRFTMNGDDRADLKRMTDALAIRLRFSSTSA